jgi:hypothetical protein
MTATAPASSAMRASSAVVTSMMQPPLSICARPTCEGGRGGVGGGRMGDAAGISATHGPSGRDGGCAPTRGARRSVQNRMLRSSKQLKGTQPALAPPARTPTKTWLLGAPPTRAARCSAAHLHRECAGLLLRHPVLSCALAGVTGDTACCGCGLRGNKSCDGRAPPAAWARRAAQRYLPGRRRERGPHSPRAPPRAPVLGAQDPCQPWQTANAR